MIPSSLQEKSQVSATPLDDDGSNSWANINSARSSQAVVSRGNDRFNQLPPGMEIDDQCCTEINHMPMGAAGSTDASHDTNSQSMENGFTKRNANASDDTVTGRGQDLFYGDAGGFVERNNYLDRM